MACVCRECGRPVDCGDEICDLCEINEYVTCNCGETKIMGVRCPRCGILYNTDPKCGMS